MVSNIALSGLHSSFTKLKTTAHNIANSETPGYEQKRAEQVESIAGGSKISQISPSPNNSTSTISSETADNSKGNKPYDQLAPSNVDLGEQLTNMIQNKHEFNANAEVIKAENEMLGTLFDDKA